MGGVTECTVVRGDGRFASATTSGTGEAGGSGMRSFLLLLLARTWFFSATLLIWFTRA